jgi:hypothetical protein
VRPPRGADELRRLTAADELLRLAAAIRALGGPMRLEGAPEACPSFLNRVTRS